MLRVDFRVNIHTLTLLYHRNGSAIVLSYVHSNVSKNGDHTRSNDYRTIGVSLLSKAMERINNNTLLDYFEQNQIIGDCHNSFRLAPRIFYNIKLMDWLKLWTTMEKLWQSAFLSRGPYIRRHTNLFYPSI